MAETYVVGESGLQIELCLGNERKERKNLSSQTWPGSFRRSALLVMPFAARGFALAVGLIVD